MTTTGLMTESLNLRHYQDELLSEFLNITKLMTNHFVVHPLTPVGSCLLRRKRMDE
jgi:hypothetical protein